MSKATDKTDAGLKEQDHYKLRLPWYRYAPRQILLPLVRYETEYLAALQQSIRTNALDSYFSITANLGTHTFFMLFLPVLAWCGQPNLCRAMVQILAAGVFYTGGLKDFLCLPRPLSPPLVRITMSHGAALEYGFPSTHSCNALSVAVYALLALNDPKTSIEPNLKIALEIMAATYAVSIVLGRLYCGMHGFLDVFVGSAMGAAISLIQYRLVGQFDDWFLTNGVTSLIIVFALTLFAIRVHPEPADDCPCFDDSVAFAGVVLGIEASNWMHAQRLPRVDSFTRANAFDMERLGLTRTILRVLLGISTVIIWRKVAKKILLKTLPPLFRLVGRAGFLLPRRFFKQAPDYDKVPSGIQMDTLIPPISRLPTFVKSIAHPRKNRSISIGPQSAADAYETIAYRQKVRRESQDKLAPPSIGPRSRMGHSGGMTDYFQARPAATSALAQPQMPPTPASSTSNLQNGTIASDTAVQTPPTPADSIQQSTSMSRTPSSDRREREEEHAVFASLPKPRTKFDIEIATKLTVYSGIGFIVTGLAPLAFEVLGLA